MGGDAVLNIGDGCTVRINVPSARDLLAAVEARLAAGEGFAVATINLDHMVKLRTDPAFRDAYARQTYVVADGNPIVWLCALAGRKVDLTPGSELVEPLCALAARMGAPLALLGANDDTLAAAATKLEAAIVDASNGAGEAVPKLEAATKLEAPDVNDVAGSLDTVAAEAPMLSLGGPMPPFFGTAALAGIS